MPQQSLSQRFWEKVDRDGPNGCWLWKDRVGQRGYGSLKCGRINLRAHRLSWMLTHGPIPSDVLVLHKCDAYYSAGDITYRRCVRPDHLFLGTQAENVTDAIYKERFPVHFGFPRMDNIRRGELHSRAKLTREQVEEILSLVGKLPYTEIASKYGVTESAIKHVVRGESWRWLGLDSKVGESTLGTKVSPEQVREVLILLGAGLTQEEVARKYRVTREQISRIVTGKRKDVKDLVERFSLEDEGENAAEEIIAKLGLAESQPEFEIPAEGWQERFWSRIERKEENDCWLWRGSYNPQKYGHFSIKGRMLAVHKLSFLIANGFYPIDRHVLHTCDDRYAPGDPSYRLCVNPAHLRLGTHAENMREMSVKGRVAAGERHGLRLHPEAVASGENSGRRKHPHLWTNPAKGQKHGRYTKPSKMTTQDVEEIFSLVAEGKLKRYEIAALKGISPGQLSRIANGRRWQSLGIMQGRASSREREDSLEVERAIRVWEGILYVQPQ